MRISMSWKKTGSSQRRRPVHFMLLTVTQQSAFETKTDGGMLVHLILLALQDDATRRDEMCSKRTCCTGKYPAPEIEQTVGVLAHCFGLSAILRL